MEPYAPQLIQLLIPLWSPSTEPLLQSSLVITFTKLTGVSRTINMIIGVLFKLLFYLDS